MLIRLGDLNLFYGLLFFLTRIIIAVINFLKPAPESIDLIFDGLIIDNTFLHQLCNFTHFLGPHDHALFSQDGPRHLGHNPLGGWSVLALLLVLLIQAATGLFANDDILTEGPLAAQINKAVSDALTRIHRLNQEILLALVVIHVAAVFFYLVVKRDNLILPMITGRKQWPDRITPAGGHTLLALVLLLVVALVLYVLVFGLF